MSGIVIELSAIFVEIIIFLFPGGGSLKAHACSSSPKDEWRGIISRFQAFWPSASMYSTSYKISMRPGMKTRTVSFSPYFSLKQFFNSINSTINKVAAFKVSSLTEALDPLFKLFSASNTLSYFGSFKTFLNPSIK